MTERAQRERGDACGGEGGAAKRRRGVQWLEESRDALAAGPLQQAQLLGDRSLVAAARSVLARLGSEAGRKKVLRHAHAHSDGTFAIKLDGAKSEGGEA